MSVSLLELKDGGLSLEFDDADFDQIRAVTGATFGEVRTLERMPAYTEVEFGGERFLYLHEWTPCLIARSANGKEMLRLIAARCLSERADHRTSGM